MTKQRIMWYWKVAFLINTLFVAASFYLLARGGWRSGFWIISGVMNIIAVCSTISRWRKYE